MLKQTITRRKVLHVLGVTAGASLVNKAEGGIANLKKTDRPLFTYCLNMSTIRGQKLGFMRELETASAAGYCSVEIWMDSMKEYLNAGGTIEEVKIKLSDLALKVEDCISFNKWIVDDEAVRRKGIEEMKMEMEMLAQIGCKRMAATGMGATNTDVADLDTIALRYRAVLELGDTFGVVPQIEMWGFQKNLSDVAEVLYIAMQSRHAAARVLLDMFHLYRGNTSLDTLPLMDPNAVEMFHMNDYPAGMPYETITDADRIYPGDGIAPLRQILKTLLRNRTKPLVLSTELFNKSYYQQDALVVAKTSLNKMKAIVESL
jgi:sugar phosphate isomerase/epimerase